MLRMPRALLVPLLLASFAAWAEDPPPASGPEAETAPDAQARPALVERSMSEAQVLEQRLEKREQQQLQADDETFLALWLPANVGEPSGAVILLPGDIENANSAQTIGPLRRKLPDAGWHSLSLTLPDPDGDPLPLRSPSSEAEPAPGESTPAPDNTPVEGETPAEASAAPEASSVTPEEAEKRRTAHAQRVITRVQAAIAFAHQQGARNIILLGHGTGAYWAARYLEEQKPVDIHSLLLVSPELPAGFIPALDELIPPLAVAIGDFYYQEQAGERSAARKRLQASKRAKAANYTQIALQALPGNRTIEQEQLYRRLRGWLKEHASAEKKAASG